MSTPTPDETAEVARELSAVNVSNPNIVRYVADLLRDQRTRLIIARDDGEALESVPLVRPAEPAGEESEVEKLRAELAEVQRQLAEARKEIAVDDELLAARDRILADYPCPRHGPCIPYVRERLAKAADAEASLTEARDAALREGIRSGDAEAENARLREAAHKGLVGLSAALHLKRTTAELQTLIEQVEATLAPPTPPPVTEAGREAARAFSRAWAGGIEGSALCRRAGCRVDEDCRVLDDLARRFAAHRTYHGAES